jgi:hypothetical protein
MTLLIIAGMAISLAMLVVGIKIGTLITRAEQDATAANARAAQVEGFARLAEAKSSWQMHTLN